MNNTEQQFLKALDDKLWKAADKLRANLDAANYKHVVLGLIFLKYVSDAFEERQQELLELFKTDSDDNIYYLPRDDFDSDEEYQQALAEELEVLDYYREANVFWVPKPARWNTLKEKAVLPVGTVLWQDDTGNDVKLRSVSWLIDNALEDIEKSNTKQPLRLNKAIFSYIALDKSIKHHPTHLRSDHTKLLEQTRHMLLVTPLLLLKVCCPQPYTHHKTKAINMHGARAHLHKTRGQHCAQTPLKFTGCITQACCRQTRMVHTHH
jgi:hypothetical protein